MLHWRREDLARKAGTPTVTLRGFEVLGAESKPETIAKWRKALEAAGVEFIYPDEKGGPGVRLKITKTTRASFIGSN